MAKECDFENDVSIWEERLKNFVFRGFFPFGK